MNVDGVCNAVSYRCYRIVQETRQTALMLAMCHAYQTFCTTAPCHIPTAAGHIATALSHCHKTPPHGLMGSLITFMIHLH